jgi:light-regulated signal transduction histidine kinase (bacteriophytochrome)
VSKLQKEHARPTEPVNLGAVVRDVCLDLYSLLGAFGAQLEVDVDATPTVLLSEKNRRPVVYNLLSNALKYRGSTQAPRVRAATSKCKANSAWPPRSACTSASSSQVSFSFLCPTGWLSAASLYPTTPNSLTTGKRKTPALFRRTKRW